MSRTPISKTIRFQVFNRDQFTCQYCGRKPPAVTLEIDHVVPHSKGGEDGEDNLITACFDCNRGKGVRSLGVVPIDKAARLELAKERAAQAEQYEEFLAEQRRFLANDVDCIVDIYEDNFDGWQLTDHARESIRRFLGKLAYSQVQEAMEMACERKEADSAFKYFCGICWNWVKGIDHRNG